MMLNESQVKKVEYYLRNNGIESKLILGDFLDHVCCIIEQQMDSGLSFEESLISSFDRLPISEIKNIELFTLKLLNMETSFSFRTSLLATIPFGLFGIAWAVSNSGLNIPNFIEMFSFIAAVLSMFALLCVGWVKDFPRWSFPAVGFCLLFSAFFMMVKIPDFSDNLLGFWAWIPLLITLSICLMFKPSVTPMKKLFNKIKAEPALLLFILYGFAPFFVFLFYDETHSVWMIPVALLSTFILSLGLYFFLRNDKMKNRIISIAISGLSTLVLAISVSYLYWK